MMAGQSPRSRRVGDQIQRELAGLIRDVVRDPRVGSVTVSGVEVSRDFAHAKVYMTVLGEDAEHSRQAVEVLNGASAFLRRELSRRIVLRTTPQLHFQHDPSFDRGAHLTALIDDVIRREDEQGRDS